MHSSNFEILERLQMCETDLQAHRGYLKALEYGLRATIITHPQPHELLVVWEQLLPGIVEAQGHGDSPMFNFAFQQALAMLGEQISAVGTMR